MNLASFTRVCDSMCVHNTSIDKMSHDFTCGVRKRWTSNGAFASVAVIGCVAIDCSAIDCVVETLDGAANWKNMERCSF